MTTGTVGPETLLGGRYLLADVLAAGGMATVHIGRLVGEGGFRRTVAIKRLHPQFVHNPEFVAMFLDEARLVARIRHPNVVPTLDVVSLQSELFLVMELIVGESLSKLLRSSKKQDASIPLNIVSGVMMGVLQGLHAAHEARDEQGTPLHIVHRDVSPQNILVGTDGIPRIIDFGVAKAVGQAHLTREGQIKGKVAYMSPEQLRARPLDRRSDIYAAGVVLWETLAMRRLFQASDDVSSVVMALDGVQDPPSAFNPAVTRELDAVVMRSLHPDPERRYPTAREMALALEQAVSCASAYTIGAWVESLAQEEIHKRTSLISGLENTPRPARPPQRPAAPVLPSPDLAPPASSEPAPPVSAAPPSPPAGVAAEPGSSDISQLSLASEPSLQRPQGRLRVVPGLIALVILAWLVGWFLSPRSDSSLAAGPQAPSAQPSSPPPPASPSISASAPPALPSSTAASRKGPRQDGSDAGPRAKPSKASPDCSNPYIKGADGILRVKPGCL